MSRFKGAIQLLGQLVQSQQLGLCERLAAVRVATIQLPSRPSLQAGVLHLHRSYASTYDDEKRKLVTDNLLVDTLGLANAFERSGLPRVEATRLAHDIAALIIQNKQKMEDTFVKQVQLRETILEQTAKIQANHQEQTAKNAAFKQDQAAKLQAVAQEQAAKIEAYKQEQAAKLQAINTELQKVQVNVNKDAERQEGYLDRMKSEIRHDLDKLTASQRLDMNLEKGRMRDDLQGFRDKAVELQMQMDRDINELKSNMEKFKFDMIKTVITILGTFSAIAFTITRFVQMSSGG